MPGFSRHLFVDIPKDLEQYLICGICLNVIDSAVNSDCVHNYCRECVKTCIQKNEKNCRKCDKEFTRKRSNETANEDQSLIIILNNVFIRNLTVNSMVSQLKTKCKYESNGCQLIIEFGSLEDHLNKCEHRICQKCKFTVGKDSKNHNCFELMKNDRNESIKKFEEINTQNELKIKAMTKEVTELNRTLEEEVNKRQKLISGFSDQILTINFNVKSVKFGTYLFKSINQMSTRIDLFEAFISFIINGNNLNIDFKNINKIMFCNNTSLHILLIEINNNLCLNIRKQIKLIEPSNGWFDINSNDSKERYIITKMFKSEKLDLFIELLIFRLLKCEVRLICQSIDQTKVEQLIGSQTMLTPNKN